MMRDAPKKYYFNSKEPKLVQIGSEPDIRTRTSIDPSLFNEYELYYKIILFYIIYIY